jgi:hypothetical protein
MCIVDANGKIVKETKLASETAGLLCLILPTDGLESFRLFGQPMSRSLITVTGSGRVDLESRVVVAVAACGLWKPRSGRRPRNPRSGSETRVRDIDRASALGR